jgi:hypothetical protein
VARLFKKQTIGHQMLGKSGKTASRGIGSQVQKQKMKLAGGQLPSAIAEGWHRQVSGE